MRRGYKILGGVLAFGVAIVGALALYVSHDSACRAPQALPAGVQRMKAIVYRCYGGPEVLKFGDVAKPALADNTILIRVHAASVNPLDWHYMRGLPYLVRLVAGVGAPGDIRMGVDFSGIVEAVGKNVRRFKPGDAGLWRATGRFRRIRKHVRG